MVLCKISRSSSIVSSSSSSMVNFKDDFLLSIFPSRSIASSPELFCSRFYYYMRTNVCFQHVFYSTYFSIEVYILGGKVINTFLMADDFAIIEVIATKNVRYRIKIDHDDMILIKKSGANVRFKNGIPHCYFTDKKTVTLAHFILCNNRIKVSYNNGSALDLRKKNLVKPVRQPVNNSEYNIPGVYPTRKISKWIASIHYKDHHHFLGYYDSEILAASAVLIKWLQIYDEKMSRQNKLMENI